MLLEYWTPWKEGSHPRKFSCQQANRFSRPGRLVLGKLIPGPWYEVADVSLLLSFLFYEGTTEINLGHWKMLSVSLTFGFLTGLECQRQSLVVVLLSLLNTQVESKPWTLYKPQHNSLGVQYKHPDSRVRLIWDQIPGGCSPSCRLWASHFTSPSYGDNNCTHFNRLFGILKEIMDVKYSAQCLSLVSTKAVLVLLLVLLLFSFLVFNPQLWSY